VRGPIPEKLSTGRLLLRKPRVEDAEVIHASYGSDPEVAKYVLFRADQKVEDVAGFLRSTLDAWERQERGAWVILRPPEGEVIGMIDLRLEGEANVGYAIARRAWGMGYATEALRCIVQWALEMPEIHRIWAAVEVNNAASVRVLEKAGFSRESTLKSWMVFPNLGEAPRDCYKYVIERQDRR
jgi:ribosomal-protein-alanine N-acetyltransferase